VSFSTAVTEDILHEYSVTSLSAVGIVSHCIWTHCFRVVAWQCVVASALDLRLRRSRVPAVPLSRNDLGQVVHTHVPLSQRSSVIWYRPTGGDGGGRLGR